MSLNNPSYYNSNCLGTAGAVVLIAVLYTLLSWLTPFMLDDWAFMSNWRDDAGGGYDFSFSTWGRYFEFIRSYDNGRIANALSPISTFFTPGSSIFPVLNGLVLAFAILLLARFACSPSFRQPLFALAATWALLIVSLPWRDTIFARDYSLNYIWSAAVNLLFLWLLAKTFAHGRRRKPLMLILLVLLAVLAGGWHESFAVATICGLGLLILKRGFRLPPLFYAVLIVYVISTFAFMLSPGMTGRIGNALGSNIHRPGYRNMVPLFFLFITVALMLLSRHGRSRLREVFWADVSVVCVGIVIGGYIISVCTVNTARSYFWPDMAAVCIEIRLLTALLSSMKAFKDKPTLSVRRMVLGPATAFILLLCTAQTVAVIVWQARYFREWQEVMALLDESESGIVHYNFSLPPSPPSYTLGIPVGNEVWMHPWHPHQLRTYYLTPVIEVIPE